MMRTLFALLVALFPALSAAQTIDYDIGNQTFPAFRADLNNHLGAIVTQNAGTVAPATTFPYMAWADTSGATPVLRYRNAADSGWAAAFQINPSSTTWLGGITTGSATITGGSINGTAIGGTTPSSGAFSNLNVFGNSFFESSAPLLVLSELDGATTHRRSALVQDGNQFQIQTRNSSGGFVAQDYVIDKFLDGPNSHTWFVRGNTTALRLEPTSLRTRAILPLTTGWDIGSRGVGLAQEIIRFGTIYLQNAPNVASDERLKHDIADVAEAECRVADRIEIRRYRMNDNPDRVRFGAIAQDVIAAFDAEGLDWRDYAIVTGSEETSYGVVYDELQNLKLACM